MRKTIRIAFIVRDTIMHEFLGIMILSAILKQKGHLVKLIRCAEKNWFKGLLEFSPEIIGFSVMTGSHRFYTELCRDIKKRVNVFSVFGGPHPTFFPEMIEEDGVDAICIGEGESAISELLDRLANNERITDIANLYVKQNGEIFRNSVRPLIYNLDDVPFPDRAVIYEKDKLLMRSKMKYFLASRGCPYICTYCFNESYYQIYRNKGNRVRHRSVDNVLAEIKTVRSAFPLEFVRFADDTFILNSEWVDEFCLKYNKEIKLPFICNLRANLVTERIVKGLKYSGCKGVYMAIEAGNDSIRNEVLRRNMSRQQMDNAFRILHDNKIAVASENILGIPGETFDTAMETLRLNIKYRPDNAVATIFQPYPKTALGDLAIKQGFFSGNFDAIHESYFNKSALRFRTLSEKRKIENLQKFFGIAVTFPWLIPVIKLAIRLPMSPLYNLMYRFWDSYRKRKTMFTMHFSISDYLSIIKRIIYYR
jgi:anaerobic magnesium-protoporphyrin IX monomethyl ester cyclase